MKFLNIRKCVKNFTETPQKKEETPQQNKVLKVFSKNGNASKKVETPQLNQVFKNTETPQKFCGNASKKRGNTSTKSGFKKYGNASKILQKRLKKKETPQPNQVKKTETPQKKEETPQLNQVFKLQKRLKNFAEMPQKYWEIPQKYWEIPQK